MWSEMSVCSEWWRGGGGSAENFCYTENVRYFNLKLKDNLGFY
jgi:hypothetical protein